MLQITIGIQYDCLQVTAADFSCLMDETPSCLLSANMPAHASHKVPSAVLTLLITPTKQSNTICQCVK